LFGVLIAIQLDNQTTVEAAEVRDEISYWHLTPELNAHEGPISKKSPELALGFCHFSPEVTAAIEKYRFDWRFGPHFLAS
jgi:hypothetical protein